MDDFKAFVYNNAFIDVIPKKGTYSWTNRRKDNCQIAVRIDCFLSFALWIIEKFVLHSDTLPWSYSDLFPISLVIQTSTTTPASKLPSKFQSMWFRHHDFLPLLEIWWKKDPKVDGIFQFRFYQKMKHIKTQIKEWNTYVFKNIFAQKEIVEKQLHDINEIIIHNGMNQNTYMHKKCFKQNGRNFQLEKRYIGDKSLENCGLKKVTKILSFFIDQHK